MMKKRLKKSGVSIEEYVLVLEKQLRELEGESERAESLAKEVDRLREVERGHVELIGKLNEEIEELNRTIIEERQRHLEEIEALKKAHEEEIRTLTENYEKQISELTESYEKRIAEIGRAHV